MRSVVGCVLDLDAKSLVYFGEPGVEVIGFIERVVLYLLLIFRFPKVCSEVFLTVIYFIKRLLFKPLYTLAFFPETMFDGYHWGVVVLIHCLVDAEAVLFATHPLAHIDTTICPLVNTITMLFVVLILAHVAPAVGPSVNTHSMHIVVQPFSLELPTVEPTVCAESFDFVLVPLTLILGAIVPTVKPDSMLLTSHVFALVDGSVGPALLAGAVLQVIAPVPLIHGAVDVVVDAVTIGLVIDPVSFVNIAIYVGELALAMSAVVFPLALVAGTVWPLLLPVAVSEATNPLSAVGRACLERVGRPLLSLGVRVVRPVPRDRLPAFLNSKVPRVSLQEIHTIRNNSNTISTICSKQTAQNHKDAIV